MTILDKIYSLDQHPTVDLRINGVRVLNWISLKGGASIDAPVAALDIEVPARIPQFTRGMTVTLDAGYDNELVRVFTGGLFANGDENPDLLRTQCFVRGVTASNGTPIQATASVINPPKVWPPIPAGKYIDFEVSGNPLVWENSNAAEIAARELGRAARIPRRPSGTPLTYTIHCLSDLHGAFRDYKIPARDVSGQMVKQAMSGVFGDSGISAWQLAFTDYQLAPSGALMSRSPGSAMLQYLMQLFGGCMQVLPNQVVLVRVVEEQPAPVANFTYKTTDQAYARIIDDTSEMRVPFNPLLQWGQTTDLDIDYLQETGRHFVRGHRWEIGPSGAWSYIDQEGGEDFGGTIGINPVASVVYDVIAESDGTNIVLDVQFDASSSVVAGGVTDSEVSWTDNQASHRISGTGVRKTVIIQESLLVAPWIVTATVTDPATGLAGTVDVTVDFSAGSAIQTPALGVAAGTYGMFSPDGQLTWNDIASATETAVGLRPADGVHHGHAMYGYADGHLELTRDGNRTRTNVLAAVGSQFNYIAWDWRNTIVCWALTDDLRLYVSENMDAATPTFGLYGSAGLRTTLVLPNALGNAIGLPADGGVYIFGGNGNGFPLVAYDAALNNHWVNQILLGDILTDGAGGSTLRIADFEAPGDGMATMILRNASGRANGSIAVYTTSDPPGTSAHYTRATGLTAGLTEGRVILANAPLAAVKRIALFNNRDVWKSTDGIAYTKTANVITSGFTPNHGLWLSDVLTGLPAIDGVYYLAVEDATGTGGILKSTDELASVFFVRGPSVGSWPAGAKAKMLALGAPAQTTVAPGQGSLAVITQSASPRTITKLIAGNPNWTALVSVTGLTVTSPYLVCADGSHFYALNNTMDSTTAPGDMKRSPDGGATWAAGLAKAQHMAVGADGRLWAFSRPSSLHYTIWYSDDNGATWTSSYVDVGGGNFGSFLIACHPTNPNLIALWAENGSGNSEFIVTTTRGAAWNRYAPGTPRPDQTQGGVAYAYGFRILANGRFVCSGYFNGTHNMVQTSDDDGQSWTVRYDVSAGQLIYGNLGVSGAKLVFMQNASHVSKPVVSTDSATSWAVLGLAQSVEQFTGNNTITILFADYDAGADILYVTTNDGNFPVLKLSPVTAAGVWTNLKDAIGSTAFGNASMAVVPA